MKAKMRMNVESQLRHSMSRGELSLCYQPIVETATGQIIKTEALLRWNSTELGTITPEYFIPVAEETGLIVPIGEWVIHTACAQVKQWRDAGWDNLCVTVNVSARQFQDDCGLYEIVCDALKANNLPASALQLELTEGVLMRESKKSIEVMDALVQAGIKFLIDDFGTGYASLSYLQRYRFDSIKIDSSYINNVLVNDQNAKLVTGVIAMASSLGMSVVSEGVETSGQFEYLIEAKCRYAQGNYFSKPLPADDFTRLLDKMNGRSKNAPALELVSKRTVI